MCGLGRLPLGMCTVRYVRLLGYALLFQTKVIAPELIVAVICSLLGNVQRTLRPMGTCNIPRTRLIDVTMEAAEMALTCRPPSLEEASANSCRINHFSGSIPTDLIPVFTTANRAVAHRRPHWLPGDCHAGRFVHNPLHFTE